MCYFDYSDNTHFGLNLAGLRAAPLNNKLQGKMTAMELEICGASDYMTSVDVLACDAPRFLPARHFPYEALAKYAYPQELEGDPVVLAMECGKGLVLLPAVHFESVYLRAHTLALIYNEILKENADKSESVNGTL